MTWTGFGGSGCTNKIWPDLRFLLEKETIGL